MIEILIAALCIISIVLITIGIFLTLKKRRFTKEYDLMDGRDFEFFCAELLEKRGFLEVEVTKGSGDNGVDILAEKDGVTYAIQCKRYEEPIGVKAVQEAYAGDIIGIFDPGVYSIGDTLTTSKEKFRFEGIPTFAPEHFARCSLVDSMKRKQFVKGITQIAQEGAIQIFQEYKGGMEEIIVGVVGVLLRVASFSLYILITFSLSIS